MASFRTAGAPHRDARSLAVDFANTVACPGCRGGDALDSAGDARRWLRAHVPGRPPSLRTSDLRPLRGFREQLRELLSAATEGRRPAPRSLESVNRAARGGLVGTELRWAAGTWTAMPRGTAGSSRQLVEGLIAQSAVDLLGTGPAPPLRRCQGPGCIHFLTARTRQQRWCSPTGCGNRARVQRHYRKSRSRATRP